MSFYPLLDYIDVSTFIGKVMETIRGVKDNPSSPEKLYICLSLFSVYYHKRLIPQVRGINHSLLSGLKVRVPSLMASYMFHCGECAPNTDFFPMP